MDLISINLTADQVSNGSYLLQRFKKDNGQLTELSVISNRNSIPQSTDLIGYDTVPLNEIVTKNIPEWNRVGTATLWFAREDASFHHAEFGKSKTAA